MKPLLFGMTVLFWTLPGGDLVWQDSTGLDPLITAKQLQSILGTDELVILDMGPERESYDAAHIPGSIYVDWVDDITDLSEAASYKLIERESMQKLLRRLGITEDSRIVIYDDMNSRVSTRMFWSLKYYGLGKLQILDGGRPAWVATGGQMSDEATEAPASEISIESANTKMSADLDFIADRLQDPNVSLIDGRPIAQYSGKDPGRVFHTGALHEKRGHIPGAVNIFWKDNFNEDGTFKSRTELEKLYESVTGSEMVVTYCNEGLHAAPAWFVLTELLGHGNVRVYDESMAEWGNSDQPTETSSDENKSP